MSSPLDSQAREGIFYASPHVTTKKALCQELVRVPASLVTAGSQRGARALHLCRSCKQDSTFGIQKSLVQTSPCSQTKAERWKEPYTTAGQALVP